MPNWALYELPHAWREMKSISNLLLQQYVTFLKMDTIHESPEYILNFDPKLYHDYFVQYVSQLPSTSESSYIPQAPFNTNILGVDGTSIQANSIHATSDIDWFSISSMSNYPIYDNTNTDNESISSWPSISSNSSPEAIPWDPPAPPTPQTKDLLPFGVASGPGTWRCAFPGCTSKTKFFRRCGLRKHYKRHRKHLFCRHIGCPKSLSGGFSSQKDLARHEAKHNPSIVCQWEGCARLFSRRDNMRDHIRRVHLKGPC